MSRPPHEPTEKDRRTVQGMIAYGVPHEDVARVLGIDPKTLRKHYREEIDTASTRANAKVAELIFTAASGRALERGASWADCTRAAFFWAKTRMGWRETDRHEITGADGGPVQTEDVTARDADAFTRSIAGLAARTGKGGEAGEPGAGNESGA